MPTLAELFALPNVESPRLDGRSWLPLLEGDTRWLSRTLVVHSQQIDHYWAVEVTEAGQYEVVLRARPP